MPWEPIIAGYITGVTSLAVGYPLDSIKVLLQSQTHNDNKTPTRKGYSSVFSKHYNSYSNLVKVNSPSNLGLIRPSASAVHMMQKRTLLLKDTAAYAIAKRDLSAARELVLTPKIHQKRSIWALYSGISTPLITVGLVQSLSFSIYDSLRRILYQTNQSSFSDDYLYRYRDHGSLKDIAIASFGTGAVVSVITSPLMIIKTKQQLMLWSFSRACRETYKQPRNFYAGYGAHFFCDSVGRALFFVTYEHIKRLKCHNVPDSKISPSLTDRMFSACVAGAVSWGIIFPVDSIRSKIYAHSINYPERTNLSALKIAREVWETNGRSFKIFYRGFGVAIGRAGPVAAVCMPVYDLMLEWLQD